MVNNVILFLYLIHLLSSIGSLKLIQYFYKKNKNDKLFDYGFYFYTIICSFTVLILLAMLLNTFLFKSNKFIILSEFYEYGNIFLLAYFVLDLQYTYYRDVYKTKDINATDIWEYWGKKNEVDIGSDGKYIKTVRIIARTLSNILTGVLVAALVAVLVVAFVSAVGGPNS